MSTAAGGEVVVNGVVAVAAGAAAVAVAAAGMAVLGVGYLVCQGGYRAYKSCKKAIQDHRQKLKAEREARLQALREADDQLLNSLKGAFSNWALQGKEFLSQREEMLRQEIVQKQVKLLEVEQMAAEVALAQEQLTLVEEELEKLRSNSTPLIKGDDNKKLYEEYLEKQKEALDKRVDQLFKSLNIKELYAVTMPPPEGVVQIPASLAHYYGRIAQCRAGLTRLLSLSAESRKQLMDNIAKIEELLYQPQFDEDFVESQLTLMEGMQQKAESQEKTWRLTRQKVWEEYWALRDLLTIIEADDILADKIGSLTDIKTTLETVKKELAQPGIALEKYAFDLSNEREALEQRLESALLEHQKALNQGIKGFVEVVLEEMGYSRRETTLREGNIVVAGTGCERHPEAEISFILSPEGYLTVDLSGKGFSSQKACTQEFKKLEDKLLEHGIQVKFDKHLTTWLDYMEAFLCQEVQDLMPNQEIHVVKTRESLRIETTGREGKVSVIEVNGTTGEITQAEGQAAEQLAQAGILAEEKLEDKAKIKRIRHAKKKVTIKR
uniref:Uncharacterized protein n=1 Tax=Desulfobacca acetoxidans TaxID=60893 RepID=A0A7V4G957_9BACT